MQSVFDASEALGNAGSSSISPDINTVLPMYASLIEFDLPFPSFGSVVLDDCRFSRSTVQTNLLRYLIVGNGDYADDNNFELTATRMFVRNSVFENNLAVKGNAVSLITGFCVAVCRSVSLYSLESV